jgi:hypothetical protein
VERGCAICEACTGEAGLRSLGDLMKTSESCEVEDIMQYIIALAIRYIQCMEREGNDGVPRTL